MAIFNPNVPDGAGNSYLNYSRATQAFQGDTSTGESLKGLGETLKQAVTGADEVIKATIDQGLYQSIDTYREAQTGALEEIAGIDPSKRVGDIQPNAPINSVADNSQNIIPGSVAGAPVPAALQSIDRTTFNLDSGLRGKSTLQTYYTGRLDMVAKDYRSQFPGYRDYIDQKIGTITGINPANEMIKELVTGIQSSLTKGQAEKEHAMAFVASHEGFPGSVNAMHAIASGNTGNLTPLEYAVNWAAPHAETDKKVKDQLQANALSKSNADNLRFNNEQSAGGITNGISDTIWKQSMEALDNQSPGQMQQLLLDMQTGKKAAIDDKTAEVYAGAISAMGLAARRQMEDKLNTKGSDGFSIADRIADPNKVKAIIDQASDRYTQLSAMYMNKEYGPASATQRYIDELGRKDNRWLLDESSLGSWFRMMNTPLAKTNPGFMGFITGDLMQGKFGSLDKGIQQWGAYQGAKLTTTPNAALEETIKEGQAKGLGKEDSQASQRGMFKWLTNSLPDKIADPRLTIDARKQLADNIFSGDIVKYFKPETFDAKGNMVEGNHTVFSNIAKDKNIDALWELSDKNPQSPLWLKAKNFMYSQSRSLLDQDMKDFQSIRENPDVKFTYDTDTHKLGYLNPSAGRLSFNIWPSAAGKQGVENAVPQKLALVNSTLAAIAKVAEKEGQDPNVAIINHMRELGLDPNGVDMPSELLRTVIGPAPEKKTEVLNKGSASLENPAWSATPGAAFDNTIKSAVKSVFPSLQDWTKSVVTPANENQIKGTANAARPDSVWGNPLMPTFKQDHLTTIQTPSGKPVEVNKVAADAFKGFLSELESSGYKINDVTGYNLREKKGAGGISQHAFGNAIDINVDKNQFVGNPFTKKMESDMPKGISDMAAKYGITWGGDWHSIKDPMHFEYTGKKLKMTGETGYKMSSK